MAFKPWSEYRIILSEIQKIFQSCYYMVWKLNHLSGIWKVSAKSPDIGIWILNTNFSGFLKHPDLGRPVFRSLLYYTLTLIASWFGLVVNFFWSNSKLTSHLFNKLPNTIPASLWRNLPYKIRNGRFITYKNNLF